MISFIFPQHMMSSLFKNGSNWLIFEDSGNGTSPFFPTLAKWKFFDSAENLCRAILVISISLCNAEFNWWSISKELILGPDLENQLVGILTRFRENKVAFMADMVKCTFKYLLQRKIDAF